MTEIASDGGISVIVNSNGALKDLEIDQRAMQRGPVELRATILPRGRRAATCRSASTALPSSPARTPRARGSWTRHERPGRDQGGADTWQQVKADLEKLAGKTPTQVQAHTAEGVEARSSYSRV